MCTTAICILFLLLFIIWSCLANQWGVFIGHACFQAVQSSWIVIRFVFLEDSCSVRVNHLWLLNSYKRLSIFKWLWCCYGNCMHGAFYWTCALSNDQLNYSECYLHPLVVRVLHDHLCTQINLHSSAHCFQNTHRTSYYCFNQWVKRVQSLISVHSKRLAEASQLCNDNMSWELFNFPGGKRSRNTVWYGWLVSHALFI